MDEPARLPFRDPDLPLETRVDDLVSRLTLEEKIDLMCQYQAGVPRLGIAPYKHGTEAAHGVAWLGEATVFPQPVGLGCTWDRTLLERIGEAIGTEARGFYRRNPELHGLTLWAPTVDMARDPRWGRTEEAYGEDPFLTGKLASALIRGIQGRHPFYVRAVATLKHFLANNNETGRTERSVTVTPRDLREYYLRPFEICFREGGALSMMTAYNGVNGLPCNLHHLVRETVKGEWGMDGFVVSDAWDVSGTVRDHRHFASYAEAVAASVKAGIDSLTDDAELMKSSIREALDAGLLEERDLDAALRNTFRVRIRLGEFDPGERNPYASINESAILRPEHAELAREAARKAVVLLKNEGGLLPLSAEKLGKVAVIGPLADVVYRDWYSGTLPYAVTPLDGIRDKMDGRVLHADGDDRIRLHSPDAGAHVRAEGEDGRLAARATSGEADVFRVTEWGQEECTLFDETAGKFVTTDDRLVTASADDVWGWFTKEVFRMGKADAPGGAVTLATWKGDPVTLGESGTLGAGDGNGASVANAVNAAGAGEFAAASASPAARFLPETVRDGLEEAVRAAREADVAIVFVGNHPLIGGKETMDRDGIALPERQERLIRAVHAANPNTVVVIVGSYPYAVEWAAERVPAIVYTAHGGQEAGNAIADVLFGGFNPAGRLNMTWYRNGDELPDIMDYDIIKGGRTYRYYGGKPLFAFGHGLSYSEFRYGGLSISGGPIGIGRTIAVAFDVTNVSGRAGEEVPQLYVRFDRSRFIRPLKQLAGFERIRLLPGETRRVRFELSADELLVWDVTRNRWCLEAGDCLIMIGASSDDIRLSGLVPVEGETIPPRDLSQETMADQFDDYDSIAIVPSGEGGQAVVPAADGNRGRGWIRFDGILPVRPPARIEMRVRSARGGSVTVRSGGPDGPAIAICAVDGSPDGEWRSVACGVTGSAGRSVCIVLTGDVALGRFRFV
jgi:beta-glucosidase